MNLELILILCVLAVWIIVGTIIVLVHSITENNDESIIIFGITWPFIIILILISLPFTLAFHLGKTIRSYKV
jgi:type III secretory pathway component EscS